MGELQVNTATLFSKKKKREPRYSRINSRDAFILNATDTVFGQADLWLIRTYQYFDYPHPFLPNFKFVGGILCKTVKPLPEEVFVQSSGDDGIMVFILGSTIKNLTTEKGNMITSALGQIELQIHMNGSLKSIDYAMDARD